MKRLRFSDHTAFTRDAVYGSILGTTIQWGIKRGFFSCDAGNGMAPMMSSTANTSHPVKQGLVQGLSVYIDTLFVCSITGLSILLSGAYNVSANGVDESALLFEGTPGVHYGVLFMQEGMKRALGGWAGGLLTRNRSALSPTAKKIMKLITEMCR